MVVEYPGDASRQGPPAPASPPAPATPPEPEPEPEAEPRPGPESEPEPAPALELRIRGQRPMALAGQHTPKESGITAVVLTPHPDSTRHAERLKAARALIEALPARERVGLWLAGQPLRLVAEVTGDHAHVHRRLAAIPASHGLTPDVERWGTLLSVVARLEGPWGRVSRFAVLVGDGGSAALPKAGSFVATMQLSESLDSARPGSDRQGWRASSPEAAGVAIARQIHARRQRVFSFGVCPEGINKKSQPLTLGLDDHTACDFEAPAPIAHELDTVCDASAAARDDYPFAPRVELLLNDAQKAVFDQRARDRDESDFLARFRFGDGRAMDVTAHFRGQTSMGCERKSLSVDLPGPGQRRIAGQGSSDEFYLISLCKDDRYFRQLFGNRVLRSFGLFPLEFRLVELLINGQSRGAYLLLEKPHEALLADHAAVSAILRRRFDPEDRPPTVKHPDTEAEIAAALRRYGELGKTATSAPAQDLPDRLLAALDLPAYLRWVALNTFLENGDSVDEAYFYATPEGHQAPGKWYFRVMAWDLDDLGQPCHHRGRFALDRGDGLLYCAEGDLDHALLRSDAVYGRYVGQLRQVLEVDLPARRIQAELESVQAELFDVLDNEAACAAMVELRASNPGATTCAAVRADIAATMTNFRQRLEARRARLVAAAAAYEANR